MHGRGTNILSFYERFRFKENIYLDLSYTLQHFIKTTLINDILFCIKNLDERIVLEVIILQRKCLNILLVLIF